MGQGLFHDDGPDLRRFPEHEIQEHSHVSVGFDRVAERPVGVNFVTVSTAGSRSRKIASFLKVGNNPLHRPLGDPNLLRNVTEPDFRFPSDAE